MMDILEFFNRDDNKYADIFESALADENFFNKDVEKVDVEKTIVTAINTRLERAATHCQGLNLLCNFSSKISKENLTKYFPHWITKVTQILTNARNNSQELITVCRTAGALITSCKQVPELDKRVSIYNVKQIIGIIAERYSQEANGALLNLLIVVLYRYPESSARFQAPLNDIISSCIDDDKKHLVISGAKCYSLLVRAVERSFAHSSKNNSVILPDNSSASCHISHQINLCNNLYTIMDELFQNLVTAASELPYELQHNSNINNLQLPEISHKDILEYYTATENRFTNICIYLSTLVKVGGSGGKKFVLPNVILQVICRGLAITPTNLQKNNDENRKDILLLILPKLYTGLLKVLEALITSFRQELLPFALTIQRLLLQTLDWTQQFPRESFKNIRILAYKIVSVWLRQTGSLSGFQLIADEFLPHILKDLLPSNKNVLVLTTKVHKSSSKTNSKSEKSIEVQNHNCSNDSSNSSETNIILCSQVLSTMQFLISNVNCYLKSSFYDEIKNTVLLLLYEQYVKKSSVSSNKANKEYRLQLLKTLRVLQAYAHISTPSPTAYAIQIFDIAISQDNNQEIIEEAKHGLAETRHMVYPSAPTLMLPLSKPLSSRSSSRPSSPLLLQLNEIINSSQSKLNNSETVIDKSDAPNESPKRPRIEEEACHLKISNTTTNSIESKNKESNGEMQPNEIVNSSQSELNNSQAIIDESDVSIELPKRPRIEEEDCHLKTSNATTKSIENKNNENNGEKFEDDDMVMTFCDVPLS